MNSKQHFYFLKETLGIKYTINETDVIQDLANDLIAALYIPIKGEGFKSTDFSRIEFFGIKGKDEPINWGHLSCVEVRGFIDDTFLVLIEEARPESRHRGPGAGMAPRRRRPRSSGPVQLDG